MQKKRPDQLADEAMVDRTLWKPGHMGVYIGNGYCMDAKEIWQIGTSSQDKCMYVKSLFS